MKGYERIYKDKFMELFRRKLGLLIIDEDDENLVVVFLKIMEDIKVDFIMFFCEFGEIDLREILNTKEVFKIYWVLILMVDYEWFWNWVDKYKIRLK